MEKLLRRNYSFITLLAILDSLGLLVIISSPGDISQFGLLHRPSCSGFQSCWECTENITFLHGKKNPSVCQWICIRFQFPLGLPAPQTIRLKFRSASICWWSNLHLSTKPPDKCGSFPRSPFWWHNGVSYHQSISMVVIVAILQPCFFPSLPLDLLLDLYRARSKLIPFLSIQYIPV